MARKLTEWPSKRGPITKIMPSDDNTNRMQSEFMLKAQEVCRGPYSRISQTRPAWMKRRWLTELSIRLTRCFERGKLRTPPRPIPLAPTIPGLLRCG